MSAWRRAALSVTIALLAVAALGASAQPKFTNPLRRSCQFQASRQRRLRRQGPRRPQPRRQRRRRPGGVRRRRDAGPGGPPC